MSLPISAASAEPPPVRNPWVLSDRALTVFYGCPEMPRLSHYFARERGVDSSSVNNLIRVARAFTCFQLTELVRRVPKTLEKFPADVLIVTALPDLYFDEDIRDREARASFEHAPGKKFPRTNSSTKLRHYKEFAQDSGR